MFRFLRVFQKGPTVGKTRAPKSLIRPCGYRYHALVLVVAATAVVMCRLPRCLYQRGVSGGINGVYGTVRRHQSSCCPIHLTDLLKHMFDI